MKLLIKLLIFNNAKPYLLGYVINHTTHISEEWQYNFAKETGSGTMIIVRFVPLVIDHNQGYKSLPR